MTMRKKLIIAIVVLSLVLSVEVVGTLAWLSDTTKTVTNVFTYGDVNIDLEEHVGNALTSAADNGFTNDTFKMVPGNTLDKDPKVTVKADSEDCYLFVKINESANLDKYITYAIATGWNILSGENTNEIVIWRVVTASDEDQSFDIIGNKGFDGKSNFIANKVLVNTTVTKGMMNEIDGIVEKGQAATAEQELALRPTLSFTAYAVQKANVDTPADAWEILFPTSNT